MQKVIPPTVGRVVHVRNRVDSDQPEAALVTYVWSDRLVNVAVFDASGVRHSLQSLPLMQPGAELPEGGPYAEWMPYQLGQAAKTEQAEAALAAAGPTLAAQVAAGEADAPVAQ